MLLMPALVAARNWYWAENKRCDELPIVGTWAMGHSMVEDATPLTMEAWDGAAGLASLRAAGLGSGDWFAMTTAVGRLEGAAPRCGGRYVYAGVPRGGVVELAWRRVSGSANLSVVLVRGSGFGQTFIRSLSLSASDLLAFESRLRGPDENPPSPTPMPAPDEERPRGVHSLPFGGLPQASLALLALLLALLALLALLRGQYRQRRRWLGRRSTVDRQEIRTSATTVMLAEVASRERLAPAMAPESVEPSSTADRDT